MSQVVNRMMIFLSKKIIISLFLGLISLASFGQQFKEASMVWDDNPSEWEILCDEGKASFTTKWRGNFAEWDYTLPNGDFGTIRQKWRDDPSHWEIRSHKGAIITAKTMWRGDFTEWRITDNQETVVLESVWGDNRNEWKIRKHRKGSFEIYMLWENDFRDWAIEDYSDFSPDMKTAILFIAIYQSIPQ